MATDQSAIVDDISNRFIDDRPDDLRDSYSVSWYLEEFIEHPEIGRNAHQRLADMFEYYGTSYDEDAGFVRYEMVDVDPIHDGKYQFHGRNAHEAIHSFVNKVSGGGRGLGPEKRIKLLAGPVGSGKSEFNMLVRRYFEDYTSRDAGRMYTFRWTDLCSVIPDQDPTDDTMRSPINRDPICLLPPDYRSDILSRANANLDADYTVRNDRTLSPLSTFVMDKLLDHYDDDLSAVFANHVEVVRVIADENKRRCVETFEPKDKKNQDETELTGEVNYSKLAVYGESDPRAFDYSGAFCNANRGIFYGEELLKLQREFLYDFLHATQERTIKPQNNPRIDIDEVIIGGTNPPELNEKSDDDKMEAFNDRTSRIDFPYILQYTDEGKIYEKLLTNADVGNVHVEPHTLEMAGLLAVLTRIEEPSTDTVDIVRKAEAYDDPFAEPDVDVEELREEAGTEGMGGVSPRIIGDEIAESVMNLAHEDVHSLSADSVLDHIEQNLDLHSSIDEDNREDYLRYLELVYDEFEDRVIDDVRRAIAYDSEEVERLGQQYFNHAMAYIDDDTVEDSLSGEMIQPDEEMMRSIEQQIGITEDRKDTFRQRISRWISRRAQQGKSFDPKDNDEIRDAVEKKIWEDKKHRIDYDSLVTQADDHDDEWVKALKESGYSEAGAETALEIAGANVSKVEYEDDG